jgi:hypothetical protein
MNKLLKIICIGCVFFITHGVYAQNQFDFAAIGDLPYGMSDEQSLVDVLNDIGKEDIDFIVHAGDIKSGHELCDDKLLRRRYNLLDQSQKPLVFIPGDNEWTDCSRSSNGRFDPQERLQFLRQVFYSTPDSLGFLRIPLIRQSDVMPLYAPYRENVRWQKNNVLFVGLNMPGSNNNRFLNPMRNTEYNQRMKANFAWLEQSVQLAIQQEMSALVITIQANPNFENHWNPAGSRIIFAGVVNKIKEDGYLLFKQALLDTAHRFKKPVLLIHGDTHNHQINQPLKDNKGDVIKNFIRLETFGFPFTRHWVQVKVNPQSSSVFQFQVHHLDHDAK